ncbi:MAG: hypothetical protein WAV90_23010 [Gordonia amarae]
MSLRRSEQETPKKKTAKKKRKRKKRGASWSSRAAACVLAVGLACLGVDASTAVEVAQLVVR